MRTYTATFAGGRNGGVGITKNDSVPEAKGDHSVRESPKTPALRLQCLTMTSVTSPKKTNGVNRAVRRKDPV